MRAIHETRRYTSGLPVSVFKSPDLNFHAHYHTDVEFIYVCEGSLLVGINKERRILYQGEFAVCSSGDIHYYDSTSMHSTVILVIFRPEIIGLPGGWPADRCFFSPFINRNALCNTTRVPDLQKRVPDLLHSLLDEIKAEKEYHEWFVKSMLFELCAIALRCLPSYPATPRKEYNRLLMQKTLHYLECNFTGNITLEDAARNINLSPFHFSRLFKTMTGKNFKTYLNSLKVDKSHEMILNSTVPITDIAFECGFNSIRTFNRVFKSLKGFIPSDLRSK